LKPTRVFAPAKSPAELESAALIYQHGHERIIMLHKIDKVDGAPTIGAGRLASKSQLAQIAEACGKSAGISGWIDSRILYLASDCIVWWRPASVATMHFAAEAKILSGPAMQPQLLFAVTGDRWYVWALPKECSRPESHHWVAHAPHFNVYEDGQVCTGNVKLPKAIAPDTINKFEAAFFDSKFTHPHHKDTVADGLVPSSMWASQIKNPNQRWLTHQLVETGETIADIIKRITKGK
jgi:PRTRC genetic system protein B